jgi:DNA-binding transcriptional LysR family regulator
MSAAGDDRRKNPIARPKTSTAANCATAFTSDPTIVPRLLGTLRKTAPHVDISVRQILPPRGGSPSSRAWEPVLDDLEARAFDIAIAPLAELPVRFVAHTLYEEDFVVATRKGHPFARRPTLESYCAMEHIVVSMTGDPYGVLDELLAERRRSRRVALTVPNFMQALAHVAETDLIAALPRRLVETYAARFGLTSSELPVPRARDPIRAIATKSALMDPGVAWLLRVLAAPAGSREGRGRRKGAQMPATDGATSRSSRPGLGS